MPHPVKPVPEGYHTATIALTVDDGIKALDFYEKAFGATRRGVSLQGGKVAHAEFQIGDSVFMLSDEIASMASRSPRSLGGASAGVWLYVPDADALYARAVAAGAVPVMPLSDMFWGDRFGSVRDPSGHVWSIATHREDVTPAEMERRAQEFYARRAAKPP